MNTQAIEPHQIYRTIISEVKLRLLTAEHVSGASVPITGLAALDAEFCFLQIRKIIELVTFSAMKREEGRYATLRGQERQTNQRDHGDPAKDWQAPDILKRLVGLSPHALPIPIADGNQADPGITHFERQNVSVNHGRLIELYKKCGGYLHAKNPLVADYPAHVEYERAKYESAPNEIRQALKFLRKLLWRHAAVQLNWSDQSNPKAEDGPRSAWLVDFGSSQGQDVSLILGSAR
jgi:hypothetical protein